MRYPDDVADPPLIVSPEGEHRGSECLPGLTRFKGLPHDAPAGLSHDAQSVELSLNTRVEASQIGQKVMRGRHRGVAEMPRNADSSAS